MHSPQSSLVFAQLSNITFINWIYQPKLLPLLSALPTIFPCLCTTFQHQRFHQLNLPTQTTSLKAFHIILKRYYIISFQYTKKSIPHLLGGWSHFMPDVYHPLTMNIYGFNTALSPLTGLLLVSQPLLLTCLWNLQRIENQSQKMCDYKLWKDQPSLLTLLFRA